MRIVRSVQGRAPGLFDLSLQAPDLPNNFLFRRIINPKNNVFIITDEMGHWLPAFPERAIQTDRT
jgi:hypothetical protein